MQLGCWLTTEKPAGVHFSVRAPVQASLLLAGECISERPAGAGTILHRPSGLNQLGRAEGRGDGVRVAGAGEDLDGGVGELDDVRVSVLDRPREGVPGRLLAGFS